MKISPRPILSVIMLIISLLSLSSQTDISSNAIPTAPTLPADLVTAPSPEAGSLTRYVDFPVDYSSGALSVSVPVFQWNAGSMELGVTLQHTTGAVSVDDRAGAAGIGWSLNCGGVITRTVSGYPDEIKECILDAGVSITTPDALREQLLLDYFKKVTDEKCDNMLDRYNYSVDGYSGTFYISPAGKIIQIPQTDVKIEFWGARVDNVTDFRLTTPDGVQHFFTVREKSRYILKTPKLGLRNLDRDYTYVSAWRLSRSVSSERADTVSYTYYTAPKWTRNNAHADSAWTFTQAIRKNPANQDDYNGGKYAVVHNDNTTNTQTIFTDQHVIRSIESRTAKVMFDTSIWDTERLADESRMIVNNVKVTNFTGDTVVCASLDYVDGPRGEPQLKTVSISRGAVEVDRREFLYNIPDIKTYGRDLFGHFNRHNSSGQNVYLSIPRPHLNPDRGSDTVAIRWWTLRSITDIMGTTTEIEYEAPVVKRDTLLRRSKIIWKPNLGNGSGGWTEIAGETNNGNEADIVRIWTDTIVSVIAPSIRVRNVRVTDAASEKWRNRRFTYKGETPTVELSRLGIDWYQSLAGNYHHNAIPAHLLFTIHEGLTATLTSSARVLGFPVEGATLVHSEVTETVTGSDIPTPFVTQRQFDVRPAIHQFRRGGGSAFESYDENGCARYLGMNPRNATDNSHIGHLFYPVYTPGYNLEQVGGTPLLTRVSEFAGTTDPGNEMSRTEYTWFEGSSCHERIGHHVEKLVYTTSGVVGEGDLVTISGHYGDMEIYAEGRHWLCDTTRVTEFFSNAARTVTTLNAYSGVRSGWEKTTAAPEPQSDIFGSVQRGEMLGNLRKTVTLCGTDRIERHMLYAENSSATADAVWLTDNGRGATPVGEAWICGNDTVCLRTMFMKLGPKSLLMPWQIFLVHNRATVSHMTVNSYSDRAHPTSIVENNGPVRRFEWGYDGDCLVSDSLSGAPTRRSFAHNPLVGCTLITEPWGKQTGYTYDGGRLVRITDSDRQPVASWEYGTMGCANLNDLYYIPDGSCNFIKATAYTEAGARGAITTETIHDSFGDPWITRNAGAAWGGDDIVTLVENDGIGRPLRQWVPVPMKAASTLEDYVIKAAAQSYHEDSSPFTLNTYQDDHRRYKILSTAPGTSMQTHPSSAFRASSDFVNYRCRRFSIDRTTGRITVGAFWGLGQLSVDISVDADGRRLETYTDFRGRKILERCKTDRGSDADTYYIYDDLGQLRAVLPPELSVRATSSFDPSASSDFEAYGYLYTYDDRMRLSSKKLPGTARIDYGYDCTGALTLWSDGEQRARGVVGFALRDAAGRTNVNGEADAVPLTSAENIVATATYAPGLADADATGHTYNLKLSGMKIHKAVYYDNYRFMRDVAAFARLDSLSPWFYANSRKSMALGSLTAVFGKGGLSLAVPAFRASVTQFDIEGRPTQIHTTGLNNSVSTRINEYAFDGLPTYSYDYRRTGSTIDGVLHYYGYDSQRRLTADTVKVRHIAPGVYTDSVAAIVSRTYDRLGRPSLVRPHTEATYGYNYNLRGQITEITSRYLIQKLYYETGGRTPQYGGNVSAMEWRNYGMGSDVGMWRYDYSYDRLDRLTAADFSATATDGSAMTPDYSCGYTYDLNSNLTSLWRHGPTILSPAVYDEVDRLTIAHDGNRVTTVTDAAGEVVLENSMDYKATAGSEAAARTYDLNGNLTSDPARGIKSITNNPLGLPQTIERAEGNPVNMIYDADGNRLAYWRGGTGTSIIVPPRPNPGLQPLGLGIGSLYPDLPTLSGEKALTRILDGPFTYTEGKLTRIDTDGGYIADGRFHAVYPDFQGNIRAVACGGEIKQVNHYYPYGLPFAEGIKPDAQPYKYGAKELITDANLDLYDFHARWMNPAVPGFSRLDQMLENYYGISPYAYCAGNPIKFIDPTGMETCTTFLPKDQPNVHNIIRNHRDNNHLRVFQHGAPNGFEYPKGDGGPSLTITDGDAFINYLKDNNINLDKNTTITIVLHSCSVGAGSGSFAEQLSRYLPNATIIAPSGEVSCKGLLQLTQEKVLYNPETKESGHWKIFRNGTQEGKIDGVKDISDYVSEQLDNYLKVYGTDQEKPSAKKKVLPQLSPEFLELLHKPFKNPFKPIDCSKHIPKEMLESVKRRLEYFQMSGVPVYTK